MQAQPYLNKITPETQEISNFLWSIPEQKNGTLNIIGGSANNFSITIKISEFAKRLNFKNIYTILPDATRSLFPPDLINLKFVPSTNSGSFANSQSILDLLSTSSVNLLIGETSKNAITTSALADVVTKTMNPCIITRDALDAITPEAMSFIQNPNLIFIASAIQLQKLFRAVFFPKMILLSMPFTQFSEILHKFTLSYQVTILTFHDNNLIVAQNGQINHCRIDQTSYTPLSLWSGHLAAKIADTVNINPSQKITAVSAALFHH